jgi:hypothetical protein
MSYLDHFDLDEFKLFIQFNNKVERACRHIDSFYLDSPDDLQKIQYNKEKLLQDTIRQMNQNPELFEFEEE